MPRRFLVLKQMLVKPVITGLKNEDLFPREGAVHVI